MKDYDKLYIKDMVRFHGIPLSIISDYGSQFTSNFLKTFQNGCGTNVKVSTAFYPQIVIQVELTIQTVGIY